MNGHLLTAIFTGACTVAAPVSAATCGGGVESAVARYAETTKAMNTHAIGAFYLSDGVLAHKGGATITGAEAIERFLEGFRAFEVLTYSMTIEAVSDAAGGTHVEGRFAQQVRLPDGRIADAAGKFSSEWVCATGGWRLRRMETS